MKWKLAGNLFLFVLLFSFMDCILIHMNSERGKSSRLNTHTVADFSYRAQILEPKFIEFLESAGSDVVRGDAVGVYLLESKFGFQKFSGSYQTENFKKLLNKWRQNKDWSAYSKYMKAIWEDVTYFPVPVSTENKKLTFSFVDSWMSERNFGGKRGHEGTDIMAAKNESDLYPILSMTDGKVVSKGWLPQGGYRLGILSPSGGYFYYAHLSSYANLSEGDEVKAGQLLGYMGDTGYGPEGTKGKFDVHLHVGIYIYPEDQETSINPYWILKFLENHKLKYAYS